LNHEGVIEVFLSFISRVESKPGVATSAEALAEVGDNFAKLGAQYHNVREEGDAVQQEDEDDASSKAAVVVADEQPFREWSDVPMRHRARPAADDAAEQTATRRSFHVMTILTAQRQSPMLLAGLIPKLPAMVLKVMSVFHPASKGNFYHACAVLQKLAGMFTGPVLKTICSPSVGNNIAMLSQDRAFFRLPLVCPLLCAFDAPVLDEWFAAPVGFQN
jgi:hypothetical protein